MIENMTSRQVKQSSITIKLFYINYLSGVTRLFEVITLYGKISCFVGNTGKKNFETCENFGHLTLVNASMHHI